MQFAPNNRLWRDTFAFCQPALRDPKGHHLHSWRLWSTPRGESSSSGSGPSQSRKRATSRHQSFALSPAHSREARQCSTFVVAFTIVENGSNDVAFSRKWLQRTVVPYRRGHLQPWSIPASEGNVKSSKKHLPRPTFRNSLGISQNSPSLTI